MKIKKLHNWQISPKEAIQLQKELAGRIEIRIFNKKPATVAGLDCAFSNDKKNIIACAVVLSAKTFEILETASIVQAVNFPYIPGLLSFREAPACLAAIEKLTIAPDCFIIDGQGLAHPRRLGIASHLGLFLDVPTIGCAKSRLVGDFKSPPIRKGSTSPLTDKDEIIGSVLRTRSGVQPVFVSVGNKCSLNDAVRIVLDCCTQYRLPEPSRLAHQLVTKLKTSRET